MKKVMLMMSVFLFPQLATAGQITMVNPQEEQTDNGKTLCTYENSQYTFTFVTNAKSCPYTKTFDTDNAE